MHERMSLCIHLTNQYSQRGPLAPMANTSQNTNKMPSGISDDEEEAPSSAVTEGRRETEEYETHNS